MTRKLQLLLKLTVNLNYTTQQLETKQEQPKTQLKTETNPTTKLRTTRRGDSVATQWLNTKPR